jgi:glycosyltransferase involved in cell wall biosynthesis
MGLTSPTKKPMVLLIGNYPLDRQQSMQRFGDLMLRGLRTAGLDVELIAPAAVLGRNSSSKWIGYIDKYVLFPFRLRREIRRADVVHICDHSNAVYIKHSRSVPVVVTCHDLLAVRGGLGEETDCPASLSGRFLQRWILRSLRKADVVACVSRSTAEDADRLVSRKDPEPKIDIVPLALNFSYAKMPLDAARARLTSIPNFDVDLPFVLHVGSNLRRKNRDGVIRIFARGKDQWNGRLVFAGALLDDELIALAKQLGVFDRIVQIKNPDSELLQALYNCATALLFPSRFEGFGWPIIEAQACGCPVICSNTGPMPEAAGDAGLYHDVNDEEGFSVDLIRLTNPMERQKWSEKSLQNAQRFSTAKMIAQYIDIYRQLGANL